MSTKVRPRKIPLWPFILAALLIVFSVFFVLGLRLSLNKPLDGADANGFTAEDTSRIIAEIQADYDEPIYYLTTDASDLQQGTESSFYTIIYLVCTESADSVQMYQYYKFIDGTNLYPAGSLIRLSHGTHPTLTKADLFPNGLY